MGKDLTTTDKKAKKPRIMTQKQRKWLNLYLESGNATEAAKKVYNCTYDSAMSIGYQNRELLLQNNFSMSNWLEKQGITDKKVVDRINWLLDHNNYKAVSSGIDKVFKIKNIGEAREVPIQNTIFIGIKQDQEKFK